MATELELSGNNLLLEDLADHLATAVAGVALDCTRHLSDERVSEVLDQVDLAEIEAVAAWAVTEFDRLLQPLRGACA